MRAPKKCILSVLPWDVRRTAPARARLVAGRGPTWPRARRWCAEQLSGCRRTASSRCCLKTHVGPHYTVRPHRTKEEKSSLFYVFWTGSFYVYCRLAFCRGLMARHPWSQLFHICPRSLNLTPPPNLPTSKAFHSLKKSF